MLKQWEMSDTRQGTQLLTERTFLGAREGGNMSWGWFKVIKGNWVRHYGN